MVERRREALGIVHVSDLERGLRVQQEIDLEERERYSSADVEARATKRGL